MNCQQAKPLIDPYADGELEAAAILELEQHLQSCSRCGLEWRNLQSLKKSLKQDAFYFTAPEELRRRIKSALPSPAKAVPQRRAWNWNWLTAALSVTAACLALLLTVTLTRPSPEQPLAQEIVSSHVRSLMANHILDVVSTDQHTVKPWFNGKLDFSPPVKNLAAQEFPLIGGRLDYLEDAAWPRSSFSATNMSSTFSFGLQKEKDSKPTSSASIQGYNVIHWSEPGMTFWAVSDLNEKELMEFTRDFAAGGTSH